MSSKLRCSTRQAAFKRCELKVEPEEVQPQQEPPAQLHPGPILTEVIILPAKKLLEPQHLKFKMKDLLGAV